MEFDMKDAEDEAFDELARKQGAWGGGFPAKRQAAMDKINSDFDEEYKKMHEDRIKYGTSWSQDGKRIDPMSVYKEPVCDKDPQGCWNVRCQLGKQCKNLAQPAQEPTGMLHITRLDKWLDASLKERKQREWVGLTDSDFCREINTRDFLAGAFFAEAKLKDKNT